MAEGALDCFTALLDSIPGWIADLESIVKSATERQNDILRESQPVDSHQDEEGPLTAAREPSKSSSVRTRRSRESKDDGTPNGLQGTNPDESTPTLLQNQLPHMTQTDALRLSQRKRKTASVCSDRQSGPLKYRSRSMVVVYYDGEIQKRFEDIVRAIGSKRNSLRKGRTAAQVYELAPSMTGGNDTADGERNAAHQPRLAYRTARMRQSPRGGKSIEGLEAYDKLDAYLEKAQAQCERAAHQVLRDGDCGMEIHVAKERFTEARTHCEIEVPIWRKRIELFVERERLSEERRRLEEAEESEKELKPSSGYSSSETNFVNSFSAAVPLEVDIESDDSDGGGDNDGREFTINMMQLGRPRQYVQCSSLTAH